MIPILEIVHRLRETKGSNAKKAVLTEAFKNNPDLADFLQYVYDPMTSFYRTELKLSAYPRMLVREKTDDISEVYAIQKAYIENIAFLLEKSNG